MTKLHWIPADSYSPCMVISNIENRLLYMQKEDKRLFLRNNGHTAMYLHVK